MVFFTSTFCFNATAQDKHYLKWKVHNYCFDFSTTPMTATQLCEPSDSESSDFWFVDKNGEISLIGKDDGIYDKYGNKIEGSDQGAYIYRLIGMPSNDNIVYGIGYTDIYRIDIEQKKVTNMWGKTNNGWGTIAVTSTDCDKIWLIDYTNLPWEKYLISNNNVELVSTLNPQEDYGSFPECSIMVTPDCQHYTLTVWPYGDETYYGSFDRKTATFNPLHKYSFSEFNYDYVFLSFLSYDKDRMYCILHPKNKPNRVSDIVEIMMKNGELDLKTLRLIKQFPTYWQWHAFYGPDKNIYIYEERTGEYGVLKIIGNESSYTHIFTGPEWQEETHYPVESWYLPNPCQEYNPCDNMTKPVIKW